jgi:DNA repair protein RAD16
MVISVGTEMILKQLRMDAFTESEKQFYTALENESRTTFHTYVSEGTVLQNYASILQLILRLRFVK